MQFKRETRKVFKKRALRVDSLPEQLEYLGHPD